MSAEVAARVVPFVVFEVKRLHPGPLMLAVSVALLERRRAHGVAQGELLSREDVALAIARDLRGGDPEGVESTPTFDGTAGVRSQSVGSYLISDLMVAEIGGYLAGASAFLRDEFDEVASGLRGIVGIVVVDALKWSAGGAQA